MAGFTHKSFIWLVPVILSGQAALTFYAGSLETPPPPPLLWKIPREISAWTNYSEDPNDNTIQAVLGADRMLTRTYSQRPSGMPASLFIAWFQSQLGGRRQPHSPKVCLPGSGWVPQVTDEVEIRTDIGRRAVNRYIVVNSGQRAVVLYWYQTPRRTIAGELAAKFWLVVDAFRDHRTETALVRIVVWNLGRSDAATTDAAVDFAEGLHSVLGLLPRQVTPHR